MRRFRDGGVYALGEILDHIVSDSRTSSRPLDARFVYRRAGKYTGHFDEVVEEPNPLVSSQEAQKAVEAMRGHGMSLREIARMAGVSVESVHRSASGVGRVRHSTEEALLEVSGRLNGGRKGSP